MASADPHIEVMRKFFEFIKDQDVYHALIMAVSHAYVVNGYTTNDYVFVAGIHNNNDADGSWTIGLAPLRTEIEQMFFLCSRQMSPTIPLTIARETKKTDDEKGVVLILGTQAIDTRGKEKPVHGLAEMVIPKMKPAAAWTTQLMNADSLLYTNALKKMGVHICDIKNLYVITKPGIGIDSEYDVELLVPE